MNRFPPKKILVPIDLSEASMAAWQWALSLEKRFGAEAQALYVHDVLPLTSPSGDDLGLGRQLRDEMVAGIRRRIGKGARLHVEEGEAATRIIGLAHTGGIDLIIMGTHGRQGVLRLLLGSVAEAVVRHSPVPVLVVKSPPGTLSSVLAPVNFTPYSDRGFYFAAELAAEWGLRLSLLHVSPAPLDRDPRGRIEELIETLPEKVRSRCRPETAVAVGDPAEAIVSAARGHGLVVLVAHPKPFLEQLVLGETAERVLRFTTTPVLTLPHVRTAPRAKAPFRRSRRSPPKENLLEILLDEHKEMKTRLDLLEANARISPAALAADVSSFLEAFFRHERLEEAQLFRVLQREAGDVYAIGAMEKDHGQLEARCRELKEGAEKGWIAPEALRQFAELLRYHLKAEEDTVFPAAAEILGTERLEELGREALESGVLR